MTESSKRTSSSPIRTWIYTWFLPPKSADSPTTSSDVAGTESDDAPTVVIHETPEERLIAAYKDLNRIHLAIRRTLFHELPDGSPDAERYAFLDPEEYIRYAYACSRVFEQRSAEWEKQKAEAKSTPVEEAAADAEPDASLEELIAAEEVHDPEPTSNPDVVPPPEPKSAPEPPSKGSAPAPKGLWKALTTPARPRTR